MRRDRELINGFRRVYDEKLGHTETKREAYEAAERAWCVRTGSRFYANYGSFAACQTYHGRVRIFSVRNLE